MDRDGNTGTGAGMDTVTEVGNTPKDGQTTYNPNDATDLARAGGNSPANEQVLPFTNSDVAQDGEGAERNANPHDIGKQGVQTKTKKA